jgi:hypothetical protein
MILEQYAHRLPLNGIPSKTATVGPNTFCPIAMKMYGGNVKTVTNGKRVSNLGHGAPDVPYVAIDKFGTDT